MKTEMKKSIFFLAGILGLSLAACEDTSDLGKPQVNEPPVVVKANGVTATANTILDGIRTLNLGDYVNVNMPVLDVTLADDFSATSTVAGTLQVADNEEFTNAVEIPITMETAEDGTRHGIIEGNLWENAFVQFYGADPAEQPNWYRYELFIQDGTQAVELTHGYVDGRKINVLPVDQKLDVESAYYIYSSKEGISKAKEMVHSDKHQYDDPVFSYVVSVSEEEAGNIDWYIAPKSAYDAKNNAKNAIYGVLASTPEEAAAANGRLALRSEGGVGGVLTEAGNWKIEVNMLTKTYQVSLAAETLYVFGPASGGGFGPQALQLPTSDFVTYTGFGRIKQNFRLAAQKSFNRGVVFGYGGAEGKLAMGTDSEVIAVTGSNGSLYWISADIVKLTYSVTAVKSIGIVGDLNNWGNEKDGVVTPDVELKADRNFTKWTGTVTVAAPGSYKFRADNSWDVNLGGALDNLTAGGDNLSFSEAGTYNVTLDLSKLPYSATVVKK